MLYLSSTRERKTPVVVVDESYVAGLFRLNKPGITGIIPNDFPTFVCGEPEHGWVASALFFFLTVMCFSLFPSYKLFFHSPAIGGRAAPFLRDGELNQSEGGRLV